MKKYLSLLFMLTMVAMYMVCPAMAADVADTGESLQKINDVYIPETAECVQEGTATVYYNFYDSVNDMHYAFYNSETGAHFAMSGPHYEYVVVEDGNAESARAKVVAHDYSFSGTATVNGKHNGVTFELPESTVYLRGDADLRRMADGKIMNDEYEDGYSYTIEIRQDKLLGAQSKKITGTAGDEIYGSIAADGGTYYLIVTPGGRIHDGQLLKGSGSLYYYG